MADEKFKRNMSECPFRANLEKIKKEGVIVIRNSQDKIEEHREFKHSYNINFELLSDPTLEVV
jgi:Peroxiredoxin